MLADGCSPSDEEAVSEPDDGDRILSDRLLWPGRLVASTGERVGDVGSGDVALVIVLKKPNSMCWVTSRSPLVSQNPTSSAFSVGRSSWIARRCSNAWITLHVQCQRAGSTPLGPPQRTSWQITGQDRAVRGDQTVQQMQQICRGPAFRTSILCLLIR